MEEYILFWKGVRAQGKSVESITKQLDTLLTKVDLLEKQHRQSKALDLARESKRISNVDTEGIQAQLGHDAGSQLDTINAARLEELEQQIEQKTTEKIETLFENFDREIKDRRQTIAQERLNMNKLTKDDLPETRESVKMINRQLDIEEDTEDKKTRFTVMGLDDYSLEL